MWKKSCPINRTARWTIDFRTGHCSHPSGITTYFSSKLTPSGALRCLGPFVSETPSDKHISIALKQLSVALEGPQYFPGSYVVFGAYKDEPDFIDHEFQILGSTCGYVPCLALRTTIFGNDIRWKREWAVLDSESAIHRSGISFGTNSYIDIDHAVMHPSTLTTDARTLYHHLTTQGVSAKNSAKLFEHPPIWTPNRVAS
jgi:hypothetical protein